VNTQPPCGRKLPLTLLANAVAQLATCSVNPEVGVPGYPVLAATKAQGRASTGGNSSLKGSLIRMPCSSAVANWSSTGSDTDAVELPAKMAGPRVSKSLCADSSVTWPARNFTEFKRDNS